MTLGLRKRLGLSLALSGLNAGASSRGFANIPSSFGAVKAKIMAGQNANLLAIGDSTGNAADEWIFLWLTTLAPRYPAATVRMYFWDDTLNTYSPSTIQTGTTSQTIHLYSASVPGSRPNYLMGSKQAPAISSVPTPDAIIWNHGHNAAGWSQGTPANVLLPAEFITAYETVRNLWPLSPELQVLQNPRRDDDDMAAKISVLRSLATLYGDITLINVYDKFLAAGKAANLYSDNVHPSVGLGNTGTQLFVNAAMDAWNASSSIARAVRVPLTADAATNLVDNPTFSSWAGALPDSWTATGSPLVTKDTGTTYAGHAYSAKTETAASTSGYLQQSLSAGEIAQCISAGFVTVASIMQIKSGEPTTAGKLNIRIVAGTNTDYGPTAGVTPQGGWIYNVVSGIPVPSNTTGIFIRLFADTANTTGSEVYWDRVGAWAGERPYAM